VPPELRAVSGSTRFYENPWVPGAFDRLAKEKKILVVGTGLTAVDAALSLSARGFAGQALLLSRRGLLPLVHGANFAPDAAPAPNSNDGNPRSPRKWIRFLRRESERQGDWRRAVDTLRPRTVSIWESWDERTRGRFLRHARAFWEVHRHRLSPEVGARLSELQTTGKVRVKAGRLVGAQEAGNGISVEFLPKGKRTPVREVFDAVLLCTGARLALSLLEGRDFAGVVPTFGVSTDEFGRLQVRNGETCAGLFVLGPALRPRFWEMTAIPELREQASRLARLLVSELASPRD
jgi:uncharacterized NAD(P)/FAD-binding protein YdhS